MYILLGIINISTFVYNFEQSYNSAFRAMFRILNIGRLIENVHIEKYVSLGEKVASVGRRPCPPKAGLKITWRLTSSSEYGIMQVQLGMEINPLTASCLRGMITENRSLTTEYPDVCLDGLDTFTNTREVDRP